MKEATRKRVFNKFNGKCAYCGCELPDKWHVDHLEPIRRNKWYNKKTQKWETGICLNPEAEREDNYMPSCPSCNINKHSNTLEQFRSNIQGYLASLNIRNVQYQVAKRYGLVRETNNEVIFYFERQN
ncbi:MAG: HNH endonuclease signature motif containing protein [Parabacteroides sp.]